MQKFLRLYRTLLIFIGRVELVLAGSLLLLMVFTIVLQVVLRSGFGNPLSWMEEAMTYAFVWLTFLGASIGMKKMRHIKLVAIPSLLPDTGRLICRILIWLLSLWLLVVLLRHLVPIMAIEGSAVTVALPIDLPRSAFFSGALFVSCIMMLLCVFYYFLADVCRLIGLSGLNIEHESVLRREEEPF